MNGFHHEEITKYNSKISTNDRHMDRKEGRWKLIKRNCREDTTFKDFSDVLGEKQIDFEGKDQGKCIRSSKQARSKL